MDDLLYTNSFIPDPTQNQGYGLTQELRREKLRTHMEQKLPEAPENVFDDDILKTNHVITDEGDLKNFNKNKIFKEKRTILSINSNQRQFFSIDKELTDPIEYQQYLFDTEFIQFNDLYNRLKSLQVVQNINTYDSYSSETGFILPDPVSDRSLRSTIKDILLKRSMTLSSKPKDINVEIIDLLDSAIAASSGQTNLAGIVNWLNVLVMSGAAVNPTTYWRPFYLNDGVVKQITYNEQHPNSYKIVLPSIINHVKSIRLISTEIPNTISNITERNNIIILQLIDSITLEPVEMDVEKTLFNFILVKLTTGVYTIDTLLAHMEQKLNEVVNDTTRQGHSDVFNILFEPSSGVITINCNKPELLFHLKFYSLTSGSYDVTNSAGDFLGTTIGTMVDYGFDLWHMLGFPWPYEFNTDGTDLYTSSMTNNVNFGIHSVFKPDFGQNDFFNRSADGYKELFTNQDFLQQGDKSTVINSYKPYAYPSIDMKYIYLVLKGYKNMEHVKVSNRIVSFTDRDIFAKVLLNVDVGKIAYNSFVHNPLIFTNVIDKISELEVEWVDEQGDLVDFGKVDHSFTLEIIHYITQVDVNSYNTKLGSIDNKSYPDYLGNSNN